MIIKPFSLLIITILSLPTYATTGTITFQGQIVENACDHMTKSNDKRCTEFLKTTGIQQLDATLGYQTLSEVQQAIQNHHHQIAVIAVEAVAADTRAGNIIVSYR
ncbi:hypothetical protein ACTZ9G_002938 [Acinetobacter baumannii]|uniref:Type 1 fimbrial protein n=2 Tax=Acinetobacter baumannii TaxID=470 RepID=A0A836M193_ACIBA|nr:hypothetical protein [Acinetobacter baumannii]AZB87842.1 hypothetical protein DKE39_000320 [Acinetobacter baumannii]EHU1829127.1 hypothetical protein [Acinetobacter baumannii]EHU2056728.1 hypothetical protein [Acinetobacter baumannii]EHU2065905.1 hypothetical protein [Acinetobacter baumannii]EHU2118959.1 hypothetical protein [Acinetobacter baumannii]